MFSNQVPFIISTSFLIAILFPVFMIANLANQKGQPSKRNSILVFYGAYLSLVTVFYVLGFFEAVTLPPKIILITTVPLLLFYLIYISNTRYYKSLLEHIPLHKLVKLHIFRLIGSFFLILYCLDQLPKNFALIAGFGDIISALSALIVARVIEQHKPYAKKLTLVWNTFGLLDILTTSALAVILTKQNIETGSMGVDILTQFPFCFIPAFAPATILFLHITIYRKIFNKTHFLS